MENFTPYSALFGGLLIGFSATIMLWFNGRITGISGMLIGLLNPIKGEWLWRGSFLVGMMGGAVFFIEIFPSSSALREHFPTYLLIIAGFLVGFGTRLGSGCTSGHGICGIARLSPRSIIATGTFMISGALTVFIIRHIIGISL
jgi:uncharacterized membrane protein YedE/YeeE